MKHFAKFLSAFAAAAVAAASLCSCNGMIYDDEGDCDPYYKVRFVFERNLEYANAFHRQVEEVTLYVVDDATGKIVWQKHESGEALHSEGYLMDVDVQPGTYSLIAWCGEGHRTSFSVAEADAHTGLQCRLTERTVHPEGFSFDGSAVNTCLRHLFHGKLMAQTFPDEQGVHIYTIDLTKDTNDINVQLVQRGAPTDAADYTVTITDANGYLDWDNSILPDEKLTYYPWHTDTGSAEWGTPDGVDGDDETARGSRADGAEYMPALVADLTTSRITPSNDMRLNIYHKDHGRIVTMPLVGYFLQSKGRHAHLSHKDYLDYCSSYRVVIYLEGNTVTQMFINSWRIVFSEHEV